MVHVFLQWVEVNPHRMLTLMRIVSCHLILFHLTTRHTLPQVGSNIACPVSLQLQKQNENLLKQDFKLRTSWIIPMWLYVVPFLLLPPLPLTLSCWFTILCCQPNPMSSIFWNKIVIEVSIFHKISLFEIYVFAFVSLVKC